MTSPTRKTSLRWSVVIDSAAAAVTVAPSGGEPSCGACRSRGCLPRRSVESVDGCGSAGRELGDALVGVGLPLVVDRRDRLEPPQRLVAAAGREEGVRVGVPQSG